jgi:hypothetical protein
MLTSSAVDKRSCIVPADIFSITKLAPPIAFLFSDSRRRRHRVGKLVKLALNISNAFLVILNPFDVILLIVFTQRNIKASLQPSQPHTGLHLIVVLRLGDLYTAT